MGIVSTDGWVMTIWGGGIQEAQGAYGQRQLQSDDHQRLLTEGWQWRQDVSCHVTLQEWLWHHNTLHGRSRRALYRRLATAKLSALLTRAGPGRGLVGPVPLCGGRELVTVVCRDMYR